VRRQGARSLFTKLRYGDHQRLRRRRHQQVKVIKRRRPTAYPLRGVLGARPPSMRLNGITPGLPARPFRPAGPAKRESSTDYNRQGRGKYNRQGRGKPSPPDPCAVLGAASGLSALDRRMLRVAQMNQAPPAGKHFSRRRSGRIRRCRCRMPSCGCPGRPWKAAVGGGASVLHAAGNVL
jgi:hypothetical protein